MDRLDIQNLTVQYNSNIILQNISFTLEKGQFVCLCGANGSGKSSLMASVAASPVKDRKLSAKEKARIVAFMQQNESSLWNFTVKDYVLQGRFAHTKNGNYLKEDYEIVNQVLQELNLQDFAERTVHNISGGEFQKVRIARALAQQPAFMFLDEPAANLDYVYEPQLMALLKKIAHDKNIGILISIHDINLAWKCADYLMMITKEKKLISGVPDDIMTVDNLKSTFGVDFQCRETKLFQSLQ